MKVFSYRTLQFFTSGLYKEKGSKFLSFAYPVESELEIKDKLAALKKEYFDARHHCFAWILGAEKKLFRAYDDGEPNHSAGDPILGQIRSKDITNVLVVVVRYFGGVKLGVGGLAAAYKLAAEDALQKALIIEKEMTEKFNLEYEYIATPEVMRLVKDFKLIIEKEDFADKCQLLVSYKLCDKDKLMEKIELLRATGIALHVKAWMY